MKGLVLSPLDLEQYLLELPPMPARRVAAAIRFRLGALYPGDTKEAALDFVRNGRSRRSFLAFVVSRERLAAYREAAKGRSLISPTLVALALAPRGRRACIAWAAEWASLDFVVDGKLALSRRIARLGEARGDLERLVEGLGEEEKRRVAVLLAEGASGEELRRACSELRVGAEELRVLPLATEVKRIRPSLAAVFPLRSRVRNSRRYALAALACVDLLLAIGLSERYLAALEEEGRRLGERYLEMQKRNGASLRLLDELRAAEKRYDELREGEGPDMYELVSAIALNIGEGSRIIGLIVKERDFQLEAEGRDALSALAGLEGSRRFKEVKLHQSVPDAGGIERFSISGRYAADRE